MLPGNKWMKPPTKWLVIWKMLIILKNSDIDWYDFLTQHWQIIALRPSLTGRLFLQIKFYWDTATPPFIYIICGCFGTTGRVEYLRQRVYNPQSLIFLLPHPLGKKNLTAAALIPCYTEWHQWLQHNVMTAERQFWNIRPSVLGSNAGPVTPWLSY